MGVLSGLEPKKVFAYFEEICEIPHGSGNVDRISDYLVAFAKERGLFVIQDDMKNVIIIKEATEGYEEEPPLIIQGHMDMVAVKKPDCDMDMEKDGLRLLVEGDSVRADGTSLGGDDGIAVAYALALLDSETICHPRLEVVLTVDEEVGMDGARAIDLSMLKGNRLLNLDSEEEGIFLASCAGGARAHCKRPVTMEEACGISYEIVADGLLGGHSGAEIHKERGNSNTLMGRVLFALKEKLPIQLVSLEGGLADNAIPRSTRAVVLLPARDGVSEIEQGSVLEQELERLHSGIAKELATKDPDFDLKYRKCDGKVCTKAVTVSDTAVIAGLLIALPAGIQSMSADVPGLVETSLNMGQLSLDREKGMVEAVFAVRSSVESAKEALLDRIRAVVAMAQGSCEITGDYPGWAYRVDSPLREKMITVYEEMYGKKPAVEAIHAGLECGILGSKIADLDCVSMGPDMKDIHTTEETLSISSVQRVWNYLLMLIARKDA